MNLAIPLELSGVKQNQSIHCPIPLLSIDFVVFVEKFCQKFIIHLRRVLRTMNLAMPLGLSSKDNDQSIHGPTQLQILCKIFISLF